MVNNYNYASQYVHDGDNKINKIIIDKLLK